MFLTKEGVLDFETKYGRQNDIRRVFNLTAGGGKKRPSESASSSSSSKKPKKTKTLGTQEKTCFKKLHTLWEGERRWTSHTLMRTGVGRLKGPYETYFPKWMNALLEGTMTVEDIEQRYVRMLGLRGNKGSAIVYTQPDASTVFAEKHLYPINIQLSDRPGLQCPRCKTPIVQTNCLDFNAHHGDSPFYRPGPHINQGVKDATELPLDNWGLNNVTTTDQLNVLRTLGIKPGTPHGKPLVVDAGVLHTRLQRNPNYQFEREYPSGINLDACKTFCGRGNSRGYFIDDPTKFNWINDLYNLRYTSPQRLSLSRDLATRQACDGIEFIENTTLQPKIYSYNRAGIFLSRASSVQYLAPIGQTGEYVVLYYLNGIDFGHHNAIMAKWSLIGNPSCTFFADSIRFSHRNSKVLQYDDTTFITTFLGDVNVWRANNMGAKFNSRTIPQGPIVSSLVFTDLRSDKYLVFGHHGEDTIFTTNNLTIWSLDDETTTLRAPRRFAAGKTGEYTPNAWNANVFMCDHNPTHLIQMDDRTLISAGPDLLQDHSSIYVHNLQLQTSYKLSNIAGSEQIGLCVKINKDTVVVSTATTLYSWNIRSKPILQGDIKHWEIHTHPVNNRTFYYHKVTRETRYENPIPQPKATIRETGTVQILNFLNGCIFTDSRNVYYWGYRYHNKTVSYSKRTLPVDLPVIDGVADTISYMKILDLHYANVSNYSFTLAIGTSRSHGTPNAQYSIRLTSYTYRDDSRDPVAPFYGLIGHGAKRYKVLNVPDMVTSITQTSTLLICGLASGEIYTWELERLGQVGDANEYAVSDTQCLLYYNLRPPEKEGSTWKKSDLRLEDKPGHTVYEKTWQDNRCKVCGWTGIHPYTSTLLSPEIYKDFVTAQHDELQKPHNQRDFNNMRLWDWYDGHETGEPGEEVVGITTLELGVLYGKDVMNATTTEPPTSGIEKHGGACYDPFDQYIERSGTQPVPGHYTLFFNKNGSPHTEPKGTKLNPGGNVYKYSPLPHLFNNYEPTFHSFLILTLAQMNTLEESKQLTKITDDDSPGEFMLVNTCVVAELPDSNGSKDKY